MTYVLIYKKVEQERIINLVLESHRRVINATKETDDNKHKSVNGSIEPASAVVQTA